MFQTIISAKKSQIYLKILKQILKNFGPSSAYWKNLKLRRKYKKVKWRKPMNLRGYIKIY